MYGEEYVQNSVSSITTNNREDTLQHTLPSGIGMEHNVDLDQRSKGKMSFYVYFYKKKSFTSYKFVKIPIYNKLLYNVGKIKKQVFLKIKLTPRKYIVIFF